MKKRLKRIVLICMALIVSAAIIGPSITLSGEAVDVESKCSDTIRITEQEIPLQAVLPKTGTVDILWFWLFGGGLIMIGIYITFTKGTKEKE